VPPQEHPGRVAEGPAPAPAANPSIKQAKKPKPASVWKTYGKKKDGTTSAPTPTSRPTAAKILMARDSALASIAAGNQFELRSASRELKNDHEIVRAVVQQDPLAIRYASDDLRSDHTLAHTAVMLNGKAIMYLADTLKGNRDLVLAAVTADGTALQYVSDHLKQDRDVVMAAVKQSFLALRYVSPALKLEEPELFAEIELEALRSTQRVKAEIQPGTWQEALLDEDALMKEMEGWSI